MEVKRKKGDGSLFMRGRLWWLKYSDNGRPVYESSKSEKKTEAQRLLRYRLGQIGQGLNPGVSYDRTTYSDIKPLILSDYDLQGLKSKDRILSALTHLDPFFKNIRVRDFTSEKIKSYIDKRLSEGCANSTINRELTALKRMINLAQKQTPPLIDRNRIPTIPHLRENKPRQGFFEYADFLKLKEHLPEHLQPVAIFGHRLAFRSEEICTLKWNQIDLNARTVTLYDTKNDDTRAVSLDSELMEVLQTQRERQKRLNTILPWVFLNREGTDRVRRFDKAWQSACERAGIGVRLFHDLRRSAIRNLVRAGVSETVAMRISGHKTRSVFERYNIVNEADLLEASMRQESYLKSQTVTKTVTVEKIGVSQ